MVSKEIADKILDQSVKEAKMDCDFKKSRMDDIKKNENEYNNKEEPALPGQFNIPLPIVGGFLDSLLAAENQPVKANFTKTELGDLRKSRWATALWESDSAPLRGAWDIKDLRTKKLAGLSGRAIFNIFAESDPVYRHYLRVIHHYNFYIDPRAGAEIEDARHLGEINLFKSEWDLTQGAMAKTYDQAQVQKAIDGMTEDAYKANAGVHQDIQNSFKAVGLNPDMIDTNGSKMFCLTQHYTTYENVRYYVLFEPITKTWLRVVPLKELFKRKKWPYKSWATHDDPANFWSKSPVDDVRPVAISMKEAFNQMFNELLQRIRGKRAIDPNFFPNRAELEDFTTRFVEANVPNGKSLRDGFVEFTAPDNSTITVNIVSFLNSFLGEKTGVSPSSQGNATEDKVGIYYGNIQQVSRRMNLYSSFYKQCYAQLAEAWLDGAQENLKGKVSIRILGANGYESVDITRQDLQFDTDPDIRITGGADEEVMNEAKMTKKENALTRAMASPLITSQMNSKWLAEENLVVGGWDPSEIKRALDVDSYGDQEVISAAYEALALIMEGDDAPNNRMANQAFLQTILNFLEDNPKIDEPTFKRIMTYFNAHVPVALKNSMRKAQFLATQKAAAVAAATPAPTGPTNVLPAGAGAPLVPANPALPQPGGGIA